MKNEVNVIFFGHKSGQGHFPGSLPLIPTEIRPYERRSVSQEVRVALCGVGGLSRLPDILFKAEINISPWEVFGVSGSSLSRKVSIARPMFSRLPGFIRS